MLPKELTQFLLYLPNRHAFPLNYGLIPVICIQNIGFKNAKIRSDIALKT